MIWAMIKQIKKNPEMSFFQVEQMLTCLLDGKFSLCYINLPVLQVGMLHIYIWTVLSDDVEIF